MTMSESPVFYIPTHPHYPYFFELANQRLTSDSLADPVKDIDLELGEALGIDLDNTETVNQGLYNFSWQIVLEGVQYHSSSSGSPRNILDSRISGVWAAYIHPDIRPFMELACFVARAREAGDLDDGTGLGSDYISPAEARFDDYMMRAVRDYLQTVRPHTEEEVRDKHAKLKTVMLTILLGWAVTETEAYAQTSINDLQDKIFDMLER